MNKIIVKGRLTHTPEPKKFGDNTVTTFTVAANRKYSKDKTDFINCEAWRSTGEFVAKYFGKGQEILVTGELHLDPYEKDGVKKTIAKVVVDDVEFCGSKADSRNTLEEVTGDDLPF